MWNFAKKSVKERGELPDERGGAVREYRAMHEENFWSNCLREDERGREERTAKPERNEEDEGEKRKREEKKEESETETVKRRCGLFPLRLCDRGQKIERLKEKEENHQEGRQKIHGTKRSMESRTRENAAGKRCIGAMRKNFLSSRLREDVEGIEEGRRFTGKPKKWGARRG